MSLIDHLRNIAEMECRGLRKTFRHGEISIENESIAKSNF